MAAGGEEAHKSARSTGEEERRAQIRGKKPVLLLQYMFLCCLQPLLYSQPSSSLFSPKTGLRTLFSPQSPLKTHPCASCSSSVDSCSAFSHNRPAPSVPMIRWTASSLRFEMTCHWIGMTCCHQAENSSNSQHHRNPLFKRCRKSTSP